MFSKPNPKSALLSDAQEEEKLDGAHSTAKPNHSDRPQAANVEIFPSSETHIPASPGFPTNSLSRTEVTFPYYDDCILSSSPSSPQGAAAAPEVFESTPDGSTDSRSLLEKASAPVNENPRRSQSDSSTKRSLNNTASPHGAAKRSKFEFASFTRENVPVPAKKESSQGPTGSKENSLHSELYRLEVTGDDTHALRTPDKSIKGAIGPIASSVVFHRCPTMPRLVDLSLNASPTKRIDRRPGRWLLGAPEGW
ncbi:hypothetical protein QAD02_008674 [Eretmocerus hayati]|uniref:Uncharacterized protein n=1 Tax=Eretmocerus hayati TaxID=131215 RepID=A0ACC2N7G9_9HYME|nr:hypothetical protein QAD02_008674 [Eretmocerus hayati]